MLFLDSKKRPIQCLALLTPLLLLSGGCATTDTAKAVDVPPIGIPGQVVVTWNPQVQYLPDRLNGGRATPAISGRVYLVPGGTASKPVVADGELMITMYDEHARLDSAGNALPMEVWRITPECMKQVQAKDFWGWGYTLDLPWINTYRPDVGRVRLQVQYIPSKDAKDVLPLFSDNPAVTLHHPGETNRLNPGSNGLARSGNGQASGPIASGYVQSSPQDSSSGMQQQAPMVADMNPRFGSAVAPATLVMDGTKPPVGNAFAQWAQSRINASTQQQTSQPGGIQGPQISPAVNQRATTAEQAANRSVDAPAPRSGDLIIPTSSVGNSDGGNGPAIMPAASQPYSPSTLPPSLQGNEGAMQGVNPSSGGPQMHTLYSPSSRPQN
jgi:hypothetical protein